MLYIAIIAIRPRRTISAETLRLVYFRHEDDRKKTISSHMAENTQLPDSLAEVKLSGKADPWGRPYEYLRLEGNKTPGINGKRRRDKNANPVNSDFDLYSMGRDGKTTAQFTAKNARACGQSPGASPV